MALSDQSLRGAKISLLSNSQIRYEGLLCGLDQAANTVSLQSVRIFGTEGRKGGVDEVAPSNQLYELIVFRGNDILDLTLYDNQTPANVDPAILSVTAGTGAGTGMQLTAAGIAATAQPKPMPATGAQQPTRNFYDEPQARHGGGGNSGRFQQRGAGGSGSGRGGYQRRGGAGGGGYGGRGRGGGHYRRRHQDGHTGMDFVPAADNKKEEFKEDFDFERARREFEKNKKEFEEAKEEARHHNKVYDKSSFFDNISGDQKDRGATRMDRDEMKKADTETFGSEMVGRMNTGGMRRGGGRGGRGRYQRY